jgi:hypothetical protein
MLVAARARSADHSLDSGGGGTALSDELRRRLARRDLILFGPAAWRRLYNAEKFPGKGEEKVGSKKSRNEQQQEQHPNRRHSTGLGQLWLPSVAQTAWRASATPTKSWPTIRHTSRHVLELSVTLQRRNGSDLRMSINPHKEQKEVP